jgi:hypothetical protein
MAKRGKVSKAEKPEGEFSKNINFYIVFGAVLIVAIVLVVYFIGIVPGFGAGMAAPCKDLSATVITGIGAHETDIFVNWRVTGYNCELKRYINDSDVSEYDIFLYNGTSQTTIGTKIATVNASTKMYTISNLKTGSTYQVTVRAKLNNVKVPYRASQPAIAIPGVTPPSPTVKAVRCVDASLNNADLKDNVTITYSDRNLRVYTDLCKSKEENTVLEYYCTTYIRIWGQNPEWSAGLREIKCPPGKKCRDGACI